MLDTLLGLQEAKVMNLSFMPALISQGDLASDTFAVCAATSSVCTESSE